MPLYGAEPLELKKEWQQPGTKTERQGKTPQVPPGELQLKEHWRGSGNVPKSNTDELKLKMTGKNQQVVTAMPQPPTPANSNSKVTGKNQPAATPRPQPPTPANSNSKVTGSEPTLAW
jgi:hypothetical protein